MNFRIYPSITTITGKWRVLIKEIKDLGLEEVCFFPTCLVPKERKLIYKLLEETSIKYIPLVHLRHDMTVNELEYFIKRFKTKVFNIHSQINGIYPLEYDLSSYKKLIYIENIAAPLGNEIEEYAGICLDVSHLENMRLTDNNLFKVLASNLEKYKIGACHISAILDKPRYYPDRENPFYDSHVLYSLNNLNYVKKYKKYLSNIVALELENSISEQLKAKDYLEIILT